MRPLKLSPFGRTKAIEQQIDDFLDKLSEASLIFEEGVLRYMDHGVDEVVEEKLRKISELENQGDDLRRAIERVLYTEMLLPDARGDILSLLDELDHLLDILKGGFLSMTIERPQIEDTLKEDFKALITVVIKSVDFTVLASRAYFRNPDTVQDHIHKIGFYESESDIIAIRLQKHIFTSELSLAHKMHARDGVKAIAAIADNAEDVGDRLAIYAVKRSL